MALVKLRDLCRSALKGFEESMEYGGPCYSRNGEVEVGFASPKNFIGLYILRLDVLNAHRDLLKAKGVKIVEMMLNATRDSTGVICGHNESVRSTRQ